VPQLHQRQEYALGASSFSSHKRSSCQLCISYSLLTMAQSQTVRTAETAPDALIQRTARTAQIAIAAISVRIVLIVETALDVIIAQTARIALSKFSQYISERMRRLTMCAFATIARIAVV
jgi:hypothetical protein